MDLLEDVDHSSGESAHAVLASRPEADFIELLFEVTDLNDCLGLQHLEHLPEKNKPAVYHVAGLLILEREVLLVSKEGLVGGCGEVILQDVEDELIDDPQLNLVTMDETNVVTAGTVEAYNRALVFVTKNSIKLHRVITIEPLGQALTGISGYLGPLSEQVDTSAKVTFVTSSPLASLETFLSKVPSLSMGTDMRGPQQ